MNLFIYHVFIDLFNYIFILFIYSSIHLITLFIHLSIYLIFIYLFLHILFNLFIYCLFHSGTWLYYLTDLLSLRLVGEVGARNYVKSSFSQWALSMAVSFDLEPTALAIELSLVGRDWHCYGENVN